jgi:FlgD Ig-like domain
MSLRRPWPALPAALFLIIVSSVAPLAGTAPNILIWQPPFTTAESGQALLTDLAVLGESAVLESNLFAYSPDLSGHEIVMGVVGTTPDTHVITATEGSGLDAYVQNGGLLYLEGADCFNYDPDVQGGYNVRPIFGLNAGSDGSSIFTGDVVGVGPFLEFGFDFDYFGEPSFLDVLNPATSTAILRKKTNQDVLAVFQESYGNGSAIGISCEYGGLLDTPSLTTPGRTMRQDLLAACLNLLRSGVATGVHDESVPPGFVLHPAAPNPFGSGTTIRYELPHAASVRLRIFDVAGRLVRTLADHPEGQGSHAAHWDGRDGTGNRVASGVYFYALDAGKETFRRRIVLVR